MRTSALKEVTGHWKVLYREMTGSDLSFKRITLAVGLRIDRKGQGLEWEERSQGQGRGWLESEWLWRW